MCDPAEVLCSNGLRINHLALSLQKESQILILNVGNHGDLIEKKKLEFQLALWTSKSQILLVLGKSYFPLLMIKMADNLPDACQSGK